MTESSQDQAAQIISRHFAASGTVVIYDGDCPLCGDYVKLTRLRANVGSVELVDARSDLALYEELRSVGLDLDEGMALLHGGRVYFGAACMHKLSHLSEKRGFYSRLTGTVFGNAFIARLLYPLLVFGRNYLLTLRGRPKISQDEASGPSNFGLTIGLLLALNYFLLPAYYSLFWFWLDFVRLPEQAYVDNASIIVAIAKQPSTLLWIAFLAAPPLLLWRFSSWEQLGIPRLFRTLPLVAALIITWSLVTLDPNYWTGQAREVDGLVLIVLMVLLFFNPVFVGLWIALALSMFNELGYPFGRFWIHDKGLIIDQLIMLQAYIMIRPGLSKRAFPAYFLMAILIHLQNYLWAGLQKLMVGEHWWDWPLFNDTANLSLNALIRGWGSVDIDAWLPIIEWINSYAVVINVAVLVFQLGSAFVFANRKLFLLVFGVMAVFHVIVYLSVSILFWDWWVLALTLEIIVYRDRISGVLDPLFNKRVCLIAAALCATGVLWHKPLRLGWLDTPVTNVFEIQAIMQGGEVLHLNENALNPLDRSFDYDKRLLELSREPVLIYFPHPVIKELRAVNTLDEFHEVQNRLGETLYDQKRIPLIEEFLRRFLKADEISPGIVRQLLPKASIQRRHFWREPTLSRTDGDQVIAIRITHKQWFYMNGEVHLVRDKLLHEFPVNENQ